jgi:hypothetical protein
MPSAWRALTAVLVFAALAMDGPERASARQSQIASERPAGPSVDFSAMQADGTPATNLQASEIEIRVGDRTRVVRSLRRVTTAPDPAAGATLAIPPPYGTNDSVAAGRRFVLVIDQESFEGGRELLFRNAVEGLVGQLAPGDRAMVAALPFGGVKVPFTSDKIAIRQALTRVAGQRARTETGSALACRTRRFLESLEGFLREQGTRESPLTLVLFTAGLAAPRRDAPAGLSPGMCELQVDQFRRITSTAGAARANVYLASPGDVGLGVSPQRATAGGTGDIGSDNPLEGIEHLAGATGGTRLALDATGTASLLRVARESSTYYVAELEPITGETFGRSRSLGVRVARRGITVRARPEITLTMTAHATTTRLSVSDLLDSTAALPDLRLRVGGFTVRNASGGLRFGVIVEPDEPGTVLASAGAILIDGDVVVGRWFAKDATERPLLGAMAARPGHYRLRVVAIDAAGRTGAAEESIDAGLTPVGPLLLGSLLLGVSRDGSIAPHLEFGSELTAIASFEIYGGTAGLPLTARVEVARDLDGPALVALPLALSRADDARVVATGSVPVGALPPGDYVVRGIVRLENGETGRVVRTLRKVRR